MKKILILSLTYHPYIGGAEVAIKEITDRIPDVEFHMVTAHFDSTLPKIEKIGNVLVHRVGLARPRPSMADLKKFPLSLNKPLFQFLSAWKALQLHKKYRYDSLWAMMAHATGVPAAIFKMRHSEVRYVLTLQEGDPVPYIEKKMKPLWWLFTRAFTKADVVQAISTFLGNWARARGFTGQLEIIPNAVNSKQFSKKHSDSELSVLRNTLGKEEGDTFLVTTSRLVHKNAVDDVINSLSLLPAHVHFLVLGAGPDEVPLKKLVQEKNLGERVQFLGLVDQKEIPKYLAVSDIFIRPSRSEGMGNSFVEAMASGLPVIATQEGGISDFLFDEKRNTDRETTGWAVDANSPEQIAEVVQEILSHPEKVEHVTARAKLLALEKYDWDIVAKDMREKVFKLP